MLEGRLGLDSARIPHADRHGLMWLGRGKLYAEAGRLRYLTAATEKLWRILWLAMLPLDRLRTCRVPPSRPHNGAAPAGTSFELSQVYALFDN